MRSPISNSCSRFLEYVLNHPDCASHLLTDGQVSCGYADIAAVFTSLTGYFEEVGLQIGDCLALECTNSIISVLTLLYFLEKGYSCLLLPPVNSVSGSEIPVFCRYAVRAIDNDASTHLWQSPDYYIQTIDNTAWLTSTLPPELSQGWLFLRTSGSTGRSKLVFHGHESLLNNARNCVKRLGLQSSDRITIPVPIYHMYGLGAAFLPSILVGASVDFQRDTNLIKYLEREREFNPNIAFMTPNFCNTLLKGRRASRDYRFTVVAGDRLREETFWHYESRFGRVVPLYGSTEMGAIAAASPEDSSEIRAKTVGQPMAEVALRVEPGSMQADDARTDAGELWCQHRWGFAGYLDEAGHSIEAFTPTEWFQTKDLGRIDPEGNLDILGRCDHSVNRDGLLVFFADLERAVATIPGVETAVVVSGGEVLRGKELVAYCVITPGQALTSDAIRMACFEVLPKRAVPDRIVIVDALPLLPSGKVDRLALQAISTI